MVLKILHEVHESLQPNFTVPTFCVQQRQQGGLKCRGFCSCLRQSFLSISKLLEQGLLALSTRLGQGRNKPPEQVSG